MRKTSKGMVAAGAGLVLLVGGGGTLAFWTETPSVPGGNINAGHMNLIPVGADNGCDAWLLDSGEDAPVTYTNGDPLVPGDVLTRDCSYTIRAEGNHLRADVVIADPVFNDADNVDPTKDDFFDNLTVEVSDVVVGGVTTSSFTELDDGELLEATVTVRFNGAAGNNTEDLTTVLENATLTATQVHNN
ncbi:MAG: hypothetical protein AVDCRST_MAG47-227 [uncultured Nocardioidaceae bacterium]|uniref:Alternate signal-mediated exported protein, RER_14450 family n=1 Tax=uncultured Nocardioidaceae bacterium TaxID=253824 RepID=A0A6J4MKV7_9ACTN|nr:MAG: hypothetical protein AVDCRST_MAG47-227 [uncultured Nocardioidaceae bacterium]